MSNQDLRPYLHELFLIVFLISFPFFGLAPFFTYSAFCFGAILLYLQSTKKTLSDLGFSTHAFNTKALVIGITSGILWTAFLLFIYTPTVSFFAKNYAPNHDRLDFIRNSPTALIGTIISGGWLAGGFYEEIAFRGCIPNILHSWHKNEDSSYISATILGSLLYGLYYWHQDTYSMIPAVLGGFYWSLLIKQFKGNIWYSIISHGTFNTIAYLLIFYTTQS